MSKIKKIIALAIVSAIMATGLISAFAFLPELATKRGAFGTLGGSTGKLNNKAVHGVTTMSGGTFNYSKVEVVAWFGGNRKTSKKTDRKNRTTSVTISGGWFDSSLTKAYSQHVGEVLGEKLTLETGYNYRK